MKGVVYGHSIEIANAKLQEIVNNYVHYTNYSISHESHFPQGNQVIFDNGDVWEACAPTGYMCGKRYNIAYIDHFIDVDILDKVIMPSLSLPPYQAWHRF